MSWVMRVTLPEEEGLDVSDEQYRGSCATLPEEEGLDVECPRHPQEPDADANDVETKGTESGARRERGEGGEG